MLLWKNLRKIDWKTVFLTHLSEDACFFVLDVMLLPLSSSGIFSISCSEIFCGVLCISILWLIWPEPHVFSGIANDLFVYKHISCVLFDICTNCDWALPWHTQTSPNESCWGHLKPQFKIVVDLVHHMCKTNFCQFP